MNALHDRLHEIVDGEPDSPPPTARLIERGRRGRRARRATLAGTTAIVVGAIGFVALSPRAAPTNAVLEVRTDPRIELVAALANTEGMSFKLRATNFKQVDQNRGNRVAEGAFDPATTTGYLKLVGDSFEVRIINGDRYVTKNGEVFVDVGKAKTLGFDAPILDGELAGSADSQRLFDVLRKADAKVTKTGEATYRFEVAEGDVTLVGDIVLDGQLRVARIEYDFVRQQLKMEGLLEFSDYGTPVVVERPTNVVKNG